MAVSITRTHVRNPDGTHTRIRMLCRVTGPSSYTAGGEAVAAKDFGLGKLEALVPSSGLALNGTTGAILWAYNPTTGKIVYFTEALVEHSGDLDAYSFDVEAIGT